MGQDLVGHTAEQNGRDPTAPVRSHDDEIATFLFSRRDNGPIGLIALKLRGLTGNTRRLRRVGDMVQYFGGVFFISSACCANASGIWRNLDCGTS